MPYGGFTSPYGEYGSIRSPGYHLRPHPVIWWVILSSWPRHRKSSGSTPGSIWGIIQKVSEMKKIYTFNSYCIIFLSLKWVTLTRNVRGREFTCGCYVLQETTKKSQEFFHWWGEFLLLYMSFYFILTLHNAAVQSLLLRHAVLCVSRLRVWKLRRRHGPSATPPRNWGASLSVTSARRAGYTTSRFSQTRGR